MRRDKSVASFDEKGNRNKSVKSDKATEGTQVSEWRCILYPTQGRVNLGLQMYGNRKIYVFE